MVGGDLPELAKRAPLTPAPRLAVRDLAAGAAGAGGAELVAGTFEVGAGEIVGVAGVEGNGQSALADALAGVIAYTGTIELDGTSLDAGAGAGATARRRHSRHPARSPERSARSRLVDRGERRARTPPDGAAAPRLDASIAPRPTRPRTT